MPDFPEKELLQIIAAGDTDRVEFKESLSGRERLIRIREDCLALICQLNFRGEQLKNPVSSSSKRCWTMER